MNNKKKRFLNTLIGAALASVSMLSMATTTLIKNVNGYTLNDQGQLITFKQIAFEQDKIIAIGDQFKVENVDQEIDAQGKVMLPGLIDAHGHVLGLGQGLLEIYLRGAASEQEAANRVASFISSQQQETDWIIGRGWNQVLWPSKEYPTKASLDKIVKDKPVVLSRVDSHAIWVNSKALEMAGITRDTVAPAGGEIIKDESGEPTGILIDNAEYLLTKLIPVADTKQLDAQLNAATQHLLSLGITSAHDAGISESVANFYKQKAKDDALDFRIYAMLSATDPNIAQMLQQGHVNDDQGYLSIRSVKAYGDGALGSRGAALLKPYSDDSDNHGLLVTAQEELPTLFRDVIGANFQLNFHAIGDRANRLALNEFANTFKIFPQNKERHRIEHAQVIAVEDIPLFIEYGIIPSMQPTHATSDMNMAEDRIGATRLKGAYAWQTFLQLGARIAFGSDFPVELANPFHGLHAAVTRQTADNQPDQGWIPQEKVSLNQALRGFTLDAAYSAFQETSLGTLETGKKADFILIDRDIFAIPASAIRDTKVLQTWVNGELKYQAK